MGFLAPKMVLHSSTLNIFNYGIIVCRPVVIDNDFPSSKNQAFRLVHVLGVFDNHLFYRVTRPRGGINEWFQWLLVSLHKKIDCVLRVFRACSPLVVKSQHNKLGPLPSQNGFGAPVAVGLFVVLEADVKHIVNLARDTFESINFLFPIV